MKIKMSQALNFHSFYELVKDKHCSSLKTSYKLNKIESLISNELDFYNKKYMSIIQEYAKKDTQGNFIYTPDQAAIEIVSGKEAECQEKVIELQNLEIDLPNITFKLDEFDSLEISIIDLRPIMPFIEE